MVAGFIYLKLLITVALTRLYAVWKPFSFQLSVRRARWIIGIEVVVGIIRTLALQMITFIPSGDEIGNTVITFEIILSFLLMSMAYLLIASKLYQQKRKVEQKADQPKNLQIVPNNVHHASGSRSRDTEESDANNRNINKVRSKTERTLHIKTVKMFGVITLIFVASYIPLICLLSGLTNRYHILYLTLLNNNTNFVVYMVFNLDFRKEVADALRKIN